MYENRFVATLQKYTPLWIAIVSLLFWVAVFYAVGQPSGNSSKTDSLSGVSYNADAIKSDQGPNPNTPFFTGFENLNTYGVSSDSQRYVKDFITNFILYKLQKSQARVSLVSNSFTQSMQLPTITYGFKFGVNGADIHSVKLVSSIVKSSVDVSIYNKDGFKADSKTFTL